MHTATTDHTASELLAELDGSTKPLGASTDVRQRVAQVRDEHPESRGSCGGVSGGWGN